MRAPVGNGLSAAIRALLQDDRTIESWWWNAECVQLGVTSSDSPATRAIVLIGGR